MTISGSSVRSPSGYSGGLSGSSGTSRSATRPTWSPLTAETGMISAHSKPSSWPSWSIAISCSASTRESTRSVLVTSATFGVLRIPASSLAMKRSPGPSFWSAGTQKPMTSTSAQVVRTTSFSRSPSSVRGLWRPGVSTRISCASGRCTMPRTVWRVVCGRLEVIATFWPTRAFVRVDLPALGRPTKQAKPARWGPRTVRRKSRETKEYERSCGPFSPIPPPPPTSRPFGAPRGRLSRRWPSAARSRRERRRAPAYRARRDHVRRRGPRRSPPRPR